MSSLSKHLPSHTFSNKRKKNTLKCKFCKFTVYCLTIKVLMWIFICMYNLKSLKYYVLYISWCGWKISPCFLFYFFTYIFLPGLIIKRTQLGSVSEHNLIQRGSLFEEITILSWIYLFDRQACSILATNFCKVDHLKTTINNINKKVMSKINKYISVSLY